MTHELDVHRQPRDASDRVALGFVKLLRFLADTFFAKRYGHRAIVLETVAVRADEVGHRDVNHGFADELDGQQRGKARGEDARDGRSPERT